jgi:starch-binding outer membrane protein, SusD/RagB family
MISLRNPVIRRLCSHIVGLLLLGGCSLDTDTPDIIAPEGLDSPEGAEALRVGAIRDFGFAKDGDGSQEDTEGLVLLSGDMADEFHHSGFIPSVVEFDQRLVVTNNPSLTPLYFRLHVARAGAERAAAALQEFSLDPDNDPGIPEMFSLAGFTYVFFGENFCSGVPYSTVEGDELIYGPAETTEGTLLRAVQRFDAALAHGGAVADPDMGNLAAVGKGRALLNLGRFVEAAQAVAAVPTEFQYVTEHDASPLSLSNAIFVYGVSGEGEDVGGSISVSDVEGENGLPYRTAEDPRVPFLDTGHLGLDQTTPQFDVLKYPEEASSIVVADGIEARLIEAENQLQAGNLGGMNTILNDLRAGIELDPLDEPGSPDEGVDQLFSERAFWLYATAHRLGDMRRLVRQYGRAVEAVFPVGEYLRGGSYGNAVNFPVPVTENNNPEFDRTGCDPNVP